MIYDGNWMGGKLKLIMDLFTLFKSHPRVRISMVSLPRVTLLVKSQGLRWRQRPVMLRHQVYVLNVCSQSSARWDAIEPTGAGIFDDSIDWVIAWAWLLILGRGVMLELRWVMWQLRWVMWQQWRVMLKRVIDLLRLVMIGCKVTSVC